MIEDFWNELQEGEIHVRDNLQFELKSEFFINPHLKHNVYKQEVFLFIPNPLQINARTYSKQQFYLDQTNLIRYRTPLMALAELINENNTFSPLHRIQQALKEDSKDKKSLFSTISDELKLFAAIFRVALRDRVYELVKALQSPSNLNLQDFSKSIHLLCAEIHEVCCVFRKLQNSAQAIPVQPKLMRHFKYIDEFISTMIDEFLVILLHQFRTSKQQDHSIDNQICQLILQEKNYRKQKHLHPKTRKKQPFSLEAILYRHGLLNRFILEALTLKNYRSSLEEKHTHLLGALAAGIAMLVYMILFVWHASNFVITSFPFVAFAVFFYILKDRIKEGFKILYYKQAYRWLPDYSTEIRNFQGFRVGVLKENFGFIEAKQLPPGFLKIRNHHFHEELQALQRHETIIQYKREVILYAPQRPLTRRRRELTIIFRLNIQRFLEKASNTFQSNLNLDPKTQEISARLLPKVYHLNLIIRNTYLQDNLSPKIEIKTFRVIVDKAGIKRVEHIQSHKHHAV